MDEYEDCKNNGMKFCDRYLWKECPDTCDYCRQMEGLGIGGGDPGLPRLIEELSQKKPKMKDLNTQGGNN